MCLIVDIDIRVVISIKVLICFCRAEVLPAAESALKCFFPNTSYYVEDVAIRDKVGGPNILSVQ